MKPGLVKQVNRRGRELANGAPRIVLTEELPGVVYHYVTRFQQAYGKEIETGGMLAGQFVPHPNSPLFRISRFIGAGPRADCAQDSVLFDHEYQAGVLASLQSESRPICNLGCIHVHPDKVDVCSEGDWRADVEAVQASDTGALVFGIITVNNPRFDPLSLYFRDLKLDFFVLSEQSGLEYRHVRPTLEPASAFPAVRAREPASREANGASDPPHPGAWGPKLLKDKKRLVAEVRAMEERYGGRATLRLERNCLYWEYTVTESGRHFPIQVRYPRRYPFEAPRIFSVLPLPDSPHQLPKNELCWMDRLGQGDWNPARDTAATCIHAAHRWFACLLVFLTLGNWPAEADDGRPNAL